MKTNTKIAVRVKCRQLPTTSSIHHWAYSYRVTSISDQWFSRFCVDRLTDAAQNNNYFALTYLNLGIFGELFTCTVTILPFSCQPMCSVAPPAMSAGTYKCHVMRSTGGRAVLNVRQIFRIASGCPRDGFRCKKS